MGHVSPFGLSLTSQFVNKFLLWQRTYGLQTTGGVWDPVKAAAVGGKSPHISIFPLTPLTIFVDAPEAGPGAKIGSA